jgi:4-alpha-glucanotransferase
MLRERGLLRNGGATVQETVEALHAFIAQSPSVLLGVSLADAVGERRTQNQPGTNNEYPNWRIPLADAGGEAVLIDGLADNQRFASLVRALQGPVPAAGSSANS